MPFWNEIRHRAIFFGVKRRTVASFEEPVKRTAGNWGDIDLFWPGRVLVEHQAAGQKTFFFAECSTHEHLCLQCGVQSL